ncbi:MAG: M48 family metallopeptidase [Betaproteobacteria bacterium]|nr:MAG: M48 family metallopeptidase [Betaproteobacteria bacterium]
MNTFSILFLLAVTVAAATRLWLARRHVNYVRAHRASVPDAFSSEMPLDAHQKAADYTVAKSRFSMLGIVFNAAVLLILTFGGVLQGVYDLTANFLSDELARGVLFFAFLGLLMSVIDVPFDLYRTFVIEEKFGFNKMTSGLFIKDFVVGLVVSAVLGLPFLAVLLWLMSAAGGNWWLYAWLAGVAFWLFVQFISPTVIAPLFNKFSPLENQDLKQRIEALLIRCGFQSKGLFVMDGSKRSSHGNAYFTGFGKSKRIVFFDTLVERHDGPEVEAVLAHELGHFKRRHVLKLTAMFAVLGFVFFWLLGLAKNTSWLFSGLNISFPASDALVLTVFYLVVPPFLFFMRPLLAAYLRNNEFEADAYAAEHAPAHDLVRALVKLYKDNASTLTPDPLHSAFYDSHPPAAVRIARLEQLSRA